MEMIETPGQYIAKKEMEIRKDENDAEQEERKKNSNFSMIFDHGGSTTLREVAKKSGQAIALFFWMIENMDRQGAVVVSNDTLAEALGIVRQNVSRALNTLREHGVIWSLKKGITVHCVNPEIAWRSTEDGKQFALFHAQVIASKTEVDVARQEADRRAKIVQQRAQDRTRKVRAVIVKPTRQRDLPPPVGPGPAIEAKLEPAGRATDVAPSKGPGLKIKRPSRKIANQPA